MENFAEELRQRVAPDEVLFFLKVQARGLRFPLHRMQLSHRKVLLVPSMILAVIAEEDDVLVVKWNGPTVETEFKGHSSIDEYKDRSTFTMDIGRGYLVNGSVFRINDWEVVKMANHVPAILY